MGDIAKVVAAAVHAKLSMLELNRLKEFKPFLDENSHFEDFDCHHTFDLNFPNCLLFFINIHA